MEMTCKTANTVEDHAIGFLELRGYTPLGKFREDTLVAADPEGNTRLMLLRHRKLTEAGIPTASETVLQTRKTEWVQEHDGGEPVLDILAFLEVAPNRLLVRHHIDIDCTSKGGSR